MHTITTMSITDILSVTMFILLGIMALSMFVYALASSLSTE